MSNQYAHLKSPWKPGVSANPSGRPKQWLKRIDEMCTKDGKHPYTELMKLLPELKPREQAHIWLELLAYCQAKPKPIEAEKENELASMSTADLVKLVKEKLPELESAG